MEKVKARMGRPPGKATPNGSEMITQVLINEVCECTRSGRPIKACVEAAGLNYNSHLRWMSLGAKAAHISYVNYHKQVIASKAAAEIDLVDALHKHSTHSWQAANRLLEILDPEEYSPDVRLKVSGKIESEITHVVEISSGETKKLLDSLRKFAPNAQIGGTDFNVIDAEVVEPLELEAVVVNESAS